MKYNLSKEKIDNILLWIIRIGVFAIMFLPLVVGTKNFFPFIVMKNTLFRIFVEILFVLFVILSIRDRRYWPKLNLLTISVVVFFGIVTLTTFTGIGMYEGFWGNYERMAGLFRMWHVFLYFIIMISVFKDKKDWSSFLTVSILASLMMCFFAFAQYLQVSFLLESSGGNRLTGTIGNATYLAAYVMINFFFILYFLANDKEFDLRLFIFGIIGFDILIILYDLISQANFISMLASERKFLFSILLFEGLTISVWFLRNQKYYLKIYLTVLFLFEFFIFYSTQTRGAIVGFLLGMLFLALAGTVFSRNITVKFSSLIALAILVSSPFLIYSNRDSNFVKNNSTLSRLASISYENITTQSRLLTWKASWDGWAENPVRFIIGYGQEHYDYVFNRHFPTDIFKDLGSQIWFDRAHNIILDIGITSGLIGLIAYLSIFGLAFYCLWKFYRSKQDFYSSFLIMSFLIAYFVQNLFVFDTLNTYIPFYLAMGFIVFLTQGSGKGNEDDQGLDAEKNGFMRKINSFYQNYVISKNTGYALIAVVSLAVIVSVYSYNIRLLQANSYLYQSLQPGSNLSLDNRLDLFRKSIDEAVTGKYEARQQLGSFAISLVQEKQVSPGRANSFVIYAIKELEKSVEEEPFNVRHYLFLSGLYNTAGVLNPRYFDKAIELLKKGISLSPTRPQVYFELGQAYFMKNDLDEGFRYFKKGIDLAPKVIESRMDLLNAYIIAGRYSEAQAEYLYIGNNIRNLNEIEYRRIIKSLDRAKQYEIIAGLYLDMIKINPDMPNYYAELAATYAAYGENEKAKAMVQKAVELSPQFSKQADIFMDDLKNGKLLKK